MTNVSVIDVKSQEDEDSTESTPDSEESLNPGVSKFRNHFQNEFSQMEKIGKQLKNLQQMSQRCQRFSLIQPFLEKISALEEEDHYGEDPDLDEHIEDCSGWNMDLELALVNKELAALDKILNTHTPTIPRTRRDSNASSTSRSSIPSTQSVGFMSPASPPEGVLLLSKDERRQTSSAPERRQSYPDTSRSCLSDTTLMGKVPSSLRHYVLSPFQRQGMQYQHLDTVSCGPQHYKGTPQSHEEPVQCRNK